MLIRLRILIFIYWAQAEPKPKNEKIKSQDRQHQRSIDEESNALQGESIDGTPDIRSLSKFFYFYQGKFNSNSRFVFLSPTE